MSESSRPGRYESDAPDPSEGRDLYGQDAAAYDIGRPEYPERVWEILESRCRLGRGSRVLEIGPGTGLVTRRLLAMGAQVTAVEPNASMVAYLRESLGDKNVDVVASPFEDAQLGDHEFDLAVAATSFHWVDRNIGTEKLRRVVRPGGWVAIWWMLFEDPIHSDEFAEAVETVLGGSPGCILEPGRRPFQIDEVARRSELSEARFVDVKSELVPTEREMDAAQLRALYATMAVVLRRPPPEQTRVLDAIEALVRHDFDGRVQRRFLTALYTARNP